MENKDQSDSPITITEEDYEALYDYSFNPLTRYLYDVWERAEKVVSPVAVVAGAPGSGKTSVVRNWLSHNKLKHVSVGAAERSVFSVEVEEYPIDTYEVPGGAAIVRGDMLKDLCTPRKKTVDCIFGSDEIDKLDRQTVLFIDDYDAASEPVRKHILRLLKERKVSDPRKVDSDYTATIAPLMIIVVYDSWNTRHFTEEEKKMFGLSR